MGLNRIVCLANSYKHDHRCVAGISLDTKQWVRLVGQSVPGCLTLKESCYPDGREVALLDVFEAELGYGCGSNCHPEDVLVSDKPLQPLRRFDEPRDARFLAAFVSKGPAILQGYGDRVYGRKIEGTPVEKSLELIHPENMWWWIREENGKRKNRAFFRTDHVVRACYDLPVTDPVWMEKMHSLPLGIYPHTHFFDGKLTKTFLTLSLSEPFEGFHYKLVAGVINLMC
jgi:hypothetical protein